MQQFDDLRKENFTLKMRIFYVEGQLKDMYPEHQQQVIKDVRHAL